MRKLYITIFVLVGVNLILHAQQQVLSSNIDRKSGITIDNLSGYKPVDDAYTDVVVLDLNIKGTSLSASKVDNNVVNIVSANSAKDTYTSHGSYSATSVNTVEEPAGADQIQDISSTALLIYPNPSKEILNVAIQGAKIPESISIFDKTGKLIFLLNQLDINSTLSINTSNLNSGIYYLQLRYVDGSFQTKIFQKI